jgi:hypothetical protein
MIAYLESGGETVPLEPVLLAHGALTRRPKNALKLKGRPNTTFGDGLGESTVVEALMIAQHHEERIVAREANIKERVGTGRFQM